jgi:hypothetical protein
VLIRRILDAETIEDAKAAARELERLGRPFLNWAGKAERLSFDVPTLPLFVHERLRTKAILETLTSHRRNKQIEMDLFSDPQHWRSNSGETGFHLNSGQRIKICFNSKSYSLPRTSAKYATRSIVSGGTSACGCQTSMCAKISGRLSPLRQRSNTRASKSTIQYSPTSSSM